MARYGFEAVAEPERLTLGERLHRFGENILISLIVLAQNAAALRADTLRRARLPIYLSRHALERRFGAGRARAGNGHAMTRLAADLSELISLGQSLCDVCLATAFLGSVVTLIEAAFILAFPAEPTNNAAARGPVTVLKPLHGCEPDLPARLACVLPPGLRRPRAGLMRHAEPRTRRPCRRRRRELRQIRI